MAGKFVLCLVLLCVVSNYSECKRYGSSSSGRSSGSSWGRSWGSSSASKPSSSSSGWSSSGSSKPSSSSSSWFSSGSSKPSSSSSSWFSSGSSAPKYPSSSSGLSGYGSSIPSFSYPSSTGLSGFGSSAPKYPSSSSGLSGFGSSAPKYPSSSSGLSGFGSSAPKYPPSTGLSGSGSSSRYPPSTGLSGSGSGGYYPPSTSWSNSHPHHSSNAYNTNTGYGTGNNNYYGKHNYGSPGQTHYFNTPTYYTAPQHIYVTEYRNSGSRYGDLLTGLTLYNMGRSHSYHDHYYYNDDYYRRRYSTSGSSSYDKPRDEATCSLRIKENNKVEVLKIPCEIVSTFTEGSKKVLTDTVSPTLNQLCTTNYTVINNTLSATTTASPVNATKVSNGTMVNIEAVSKPENSFILAPNGTLLNTATTVLPASTLLNNTFLMNVTGSPTKLSNGTVVNIEAVSKPENSFILAPNGTLLNTTTTDSPAPITGNNSTAINSTLSTVNVSTTLSTPVGSENSTITSNNTSTTAKPIGAFTNSTQYTTSTSNVTIMNTTKCTVTTDPLAVKGPPVNPSNMECEVDIVTKHSHILRSKVDCSILLQYAKMPEPKKEPSAILPPRSKLKSWLANPPWWLSLFIAV